MKKMNVVEKTILPVDKKKSNDHNNNTTGKKNRFLITINVLGSVGPIRTNTKCTIFVLRGFMMHHCLKERPGMARTGLMISSLLLYLKFFPTVEESIDYYNQKRCVDGKRLVRLPNCEGMSNILNVSYPTSTERTRLGVGACLGAFGFTVSIWIRPHINVSTIMVCC
ncbi:hypothetical protein Patl1_35951 [Pistacia atlantica]|nr:hypothetical protein Patl1_35951 [Pistacia atlantica]